MKFDEGEGEVLNMSQINTIRDKRKDGYSKAEIARELAIDEKTVRKYLKEEDFSPKIPEKHVRPSILDPYKPQILAWLEEDKKVWSKQRHTGKRIYERLTEKYEEFCCSYLTVQRYVKEVRETSIELRACQELVWHPGETQADFGEAECVCQGETGRKKYLTVSFPFSNNGFNQMFNGETAECVCQGLRDLFEYIGGVPPVIVFDNATGVGRRIGDVIREAKLFQQFRAHYGFSIRFCNPNAGHEKGHVENKVGYSRRNLFVPVPHFDDIEAYNRELLESHSKKAEEQHYKKLIPIKELFQEDTKALLSLPRTAFDVCRYVYKKANGYGKVQIDGNHHYSTTPENGGKEVLVGIRAHTIDIYDESKQILVRHTRKFGKERTDSTDCRTSLAVLMRNVGAWQNSGLREFVSEGVRSYLDEQGRDLLKDALRTLHTLSHQYSFELAIEALELAVKNHGGKPLYDAAVFAARIADMGLDGNIEPGPNLQVYDEFLTEEVQP